jgi:hypothetical protein
MTNHSYLQDFDEEDLISFENKEENFRVGKLNENCRKSIENDGEAAQGFYNTLSRPIISSQEWMSQGVECDILKLGEKQWIKGRIKVRVIVEFEPDEEVKPLSELDAF